MDNSKSHLQRIFQLTEFINDYSNISKVLKGNKQRYEENIIMSKEELNTLIYYNNKKDLKIKELNESIATLDENIAHLKAENKSLYSTEYDLINKILLFEKKIAELVGTTQKNQANLQSAQNNYNTIKIKFDELKKIKDNIIAAQKRKKAYLMRRAYQQGAFIDKYQMEKKLNIHSNENTEAKEPIADYSQVFTEIIHFLKIKYLDKGEAIKKIKFETDQIKTQIKEETDKFQSKASEIFPIISSNYPDIKIFNFFEDSSDNMQKTKQCEYVKDQLGLKIKQTDFEMQLINDENSKTKTRIKALYQKIVDKLKKKAEVKSKKKSFLMLKTFFFSSKAARIDAEKKKESERSREAERFKEFETHVGMDNIRERQKEIERQRELERKELDRQKELERKNFERKQIETQNEFDRETIFEKQKEKDFDQEKKTQKDKDKGKKEKREKEKNKENYFSNIICTNNLLNSLDFPLIPADKDDKKEKGQRKSKKAVTSREKISLRKRKDVSNDKKHEADRSVLQNVNNMKQNFMTNSSSSAQNMSFPLGDKLHPSNFLNTQNQPTVTNKMINAKFNLKTNISTIEESFSNKKNMANLESPYFLDEISKNISEVNEFPIKTTFGDKKRRFYDHYQFN